VHKLTDHVTDRCIWKVPAAPHAADGVGEGMIQVESPICGLYRSEKVGTGTFISR
jgi:hypothetical protein